MMHPPITALLSDERVSTSPLAADDFDALFAVAADREIWAIYPAHDRWQEPVFRAFFDEGLAARGSILVRDAQTGDVIGHSRFDLDSAMPGEVEIGWTFLARSHWGGAYNRSLKRLMIAHAFALGFEAVIFNVGEDNLRSRRAMEKIGGVLTDRLRVAARGGRDVVHVVYRITPGDFAAGPLHIPA